MYALAARRVARPSFASALRTFASKPPSPQGSASQAPPPPPANTSTQQAPETASSSNPAPLPSLDTLNFTSTLADAAKVEAPKTEGGAGEGAGAGGRTGARSSKNSLSSIERRRRLMGRAATGVVLVGLGLFAWDLGREWTVEEAVEKKLTPETAPDTRLGRMQNRFQDIFNIFSEPQWQELLPPPLPEPHQKPLTLVVSIDDLLVSSTWDRTYGWRTAKRPGVDYFLAYLSQFYEIVIWTTQQNYTAQPIIEKLDPYRFFTMYHLFRQACKSVNGEPVKDISYLNRDPSKVIILDTHPEHVSPHPENAIVLSKWKGQRGDHGLVDMIPFLESIGIYKPNDVRPIIKAYEGKDIPLEYAKFEAAAKEKHIEEWKAKGGLGGGGFTLTGLFGGTSGPAPAVPPTYLEIKRAEAQLQYREDQANIAANKATFDRMLEEERQAAMAGGPASLLGAIGAIGGGVPQPGPDAPAASQTQTKA